MTANKQKDFAITVEDILASEYDMTLDTTDHRHISESFKMGESAEYCAKEVAFNYGLN